MPNLKPYYDAALSADTEVRRVLNEMDTCFTDGTEDGRKKALDLRPALDDAKIKAEQANTLYVSMRDASLINDNMATLFSSPSDPAAPDQQGDDPKVMKLSEFQALDPKVRFAYIKAGGVVED